jgi:hypothetical protein
MNGTQHLSRMANDIGNFFRGQSNRDEAIAEDPNAKASQPPGGDAG